MFFIIVVVTGSNNVVYPYQWYVSALLFSPWYHLIYEPLASPPSLICTFTLFSSFDVDKEPEGSADSSPTIMSQPTDNTSDAAGVTSGVAQLSITLSFSSLSLPCVLGMDGGDVGCTDKFIHSGWKAQVWICLFRFQHLISLKIHKYIWSVFADYSFELRGIRQRLLLMRINFRYKMHCRDTLSTSARLL